VLNHLKTYWALHATWILALVAFVGQFTHDYLTQHPHATIGAFFAALAWSTYTFYLKSPKQSSPSGEKPNGGNTPMKSLIIFASAALLCMSLTACNQTPAQTADRVEVVVQGVLQIAQAEESALPPADAAILKPWVDLGNTLNSQLGSCIAASGSSSSKLATCFNAFASGLLSPQELAQLKIISPSSQNRVQLWATAIIAGVNVALTAFKAANAPTPQIAATPTSARELRNFARANRLPAYGF